MLEMANSALNHFLQPTTTMAQPAQSTFVRPIPGAVSLSLRRRLRVWLTMRHGDWGGYASEVLQNKFDLNRVNQIWVMMFPRKKKTKLPGRGAEEQT
jgi:hypothetical protein